MVIYIELCCIFQLSKNFVNFCLSSFGYIVCSCFKLAYTLKLPIRFKAFFEFLICLFQHWLAGPFSPASLKALLNRIGGPAQTAPIGNSCSSLELRTRSSSLEPRWRTSSSPSFLPPIRALPLPLVMLTTLPTISLGMLTTLPTLLMRAAFLPWIKALPLPLITMVETFLVNRC